MSVTKIEKVSSEGLQSVYKVIVPADIVEQTIVERAREIGKNFKMHGFRPGHVPLPIIRNKMKEDIHRSTLEKLISDSCSNITKDAKIEELAVRPTYKLENSLFISNLWKNSLCLATIKFSTKSNISFSSPKK